MRAELLDYGVPDYDENAEALMALGISREDLDMFANQSYLDKEVFNRDVVEALVGMKSEQSASYSAVNLKTEAIAAVFQVPDDVRQRQVLAPFLWGCAVSAVLYGLEALPVAAGHPGCGICDDVVFCFCGTNAIQSLVFDHCAGAAVLYLSWNPELAETKCRGSGR